MGRIEEIREEIMRSGSPLGKHSTNQHVVKAMLEGDNRVLSKPRRMILAERRRIRYEEAKLERILERVSAVKQGKYDGFCAEGFCHELRYLRINNIPLENPS